MKKENLIAFICTSLLLITPFTVIAQENKISSNITDEPDVEGLVTQLRIIINEILHEYGYNPMIKNLCYNVLEILDSNIHGTICILLLIVLLPTLLLLILLTVIFRDSFYYITRIAFVIAGTWDRNCAQYWPLKLKSLFKSISALQAINDSSEYDTECPRL